MRDFPVPLVLKRSARAKRLRLTVKSSGVECVIPLALSEHRAWDFIEHHRDWLIRTFEGSIARRAQSSVWEAVADGQVAELPVLGDELTLRVHVANATRPSLSVTGRVLHVLLPEARRPEWTSLSEALLFAWARPKLVERVSDYCLRHRHRAQLQPGSIRVKRMRTRWGSCGSSNSMNVNWLLTFAPPAVLEYVVVHELCHIRHRDHSARFWSLVAEHLPDFGAQRMWLKRHGAGLMSRYDVAR